MGSPGSVTAHEAAVADVALSVEETAVYTCGPAGALERRTRMPVMPAANPLAVAMLAARTREGLDVGSAQRHGLEHRVLTGRHEPYPLVSTLPDRHWR